MATVKLLVQGMSCMGCVKSVKGVLEAINGVQSVSIDLASGETVIEYDDASLDVSLFKKAIDEAGLS